MDFFNIHTHVSKHPESEILSTDVRSFPPTNEGAFLSVGIHPWYIHEVETENQLQTLQRVVMEDKRITAIGESGLDKLKGPSLNIQTDIFKREITLSEKHNLPMIIHCVKAYNELIRLKRTLQPKQPWIIHGFRGKKELAMECIREGFYLSFGAYHQEEALKVVPLERLFIETDESDMPIGDIYRRIAQTKGIHLEELKESIKKNVERVFFKH